MSTLYFLNEDDLFDDVDTYTCTQRPLKLTKSGSQRHHIRESPKGTDQQRFRGEIKARKKPLHRILGHQNRKGAASLIPPETLLRNKQKKGTKGRNVNEMAKVFTGPPKGRENIWAVNRFANFHDKLPKDLGEVSFDEIWNESLRNLWVEEPRIVFRMILKILRRESGIFITRKNCTRKSRKRDILIRLRSLWSSSLQKNRRLSQ